MSSLVTMPRRRIFRHQVVVVGFFLFPQRQQSLASVLSVLFRLVAFRQYFIHLPVTTNLGDLPVGDILIFTFRIAHYFFHHVPWWFRVELDSMIEVVPSWV